MSSYIEWSNNNTQWNNGYISVVIDNELIQHFSVDELEELLYEFDIEFYVYDFIDELKEKYKIKEYREICDGNTWR